MNMKLLNDSVETINANCGQRMAGLHDLVCSFTELIAESGVSIKPFSERALQKLSALDEHQVDKIITDFASYYSVCINAKKDKVDLKDTKSFVNAGLSRMGLKTATSFYNSISADDLVEVYDLSHRQIFRNLRFYEVTGYSLGDLLTFEWPDLYYRPSITTNQIFTAINKALEISDVESHPMAVPSHFIKEVHAEPLRVCEVKFKLMAPIFDDGQNKKGYIVSCAAQQLDAEVGQAIDFI